MQTKILEIRDRGTFIVAAATMFSADNFRELELLGQAGYGVQPGEYVSLTKITGGEYDGNLCLHDWPRNSRTMRVAHKYIKDHFVLLKTGSVIDVEFILGETDVPKLAQREE